MNFDFAVEWACRNLAQSAHHEKASAGRLTLAEMPQVDHRIGQRFECVVQLAEAIERSSKRRNLSSQPNTRSMVWNRSLKMAELKSGLRPRLKVFRPRGFALILGIIRD